MLEKRSKKAVEEAKEQKANEALRRKAGQVGLYGPLTCKRYSDASVVSLSLRIWAQRERP